MTDESLKPCPFCGGTAVYGYTDDAGVFVRCQQCDAATTCIYPLKQAAEPLVLEKWNKRVTTTPPKTRS